MKVTTDEPTAAPAPASGPARQPVPALYRQFATQAEIDARSTTSRSRCRTSPSTRHYIDESRLARHRLRCTLDVPYGPTRDEIARHLPGRGAGCAGVRVHPRRLLAHAVEQEFSCVALGLHELGITTVVVNYALCPKVIDGISRQMRGPSLGAAPHRPPRRRSVAWCWRHRPAATSPQCACRPTGPATTACLSTRSPARRWSAAVRCFARCAGRTCSRCCSSTTA